MVELEEIEKSRNMQRLRISSAMKGGNTARSKSHCTHTQGINLDNTARSIVSGLVGYCYC